MNGALRTPARMAISHGRLCAIQQATINSVRACNDDRAAHFLTFHHRARVCVYVLGKMISLVPRGKAAETMRERVVARLSSSVVNNIGQNF